MASAPYKFVRKGQRKSGLPANVWNALVALLSPRTGQRSRPKDLFAQTGIVKVKNNTGATKARYSVLGASDVIIEPATNLQEFQAKHALVGATPDVDVHLGRFVVLLDPLGAGEIGRAVVSGIVPAQVLVDKEWHDRADVVDGQTSYLGTNETGAATILWKESTGTPRWAILKLGNRYDRTFPARVASRTKVAPNRWTYQCVELEPVADDYGGWQDKPGGRTVTVRNKIENPNNGIGEEGNGADVGDDLSLLPAGIGAIVDVEEHHYGTGDTPLKTYWMQFENEADDLTSSGGAGSSGGEGGQPGEPAFTLTRRLARRQCVVAGDCQREVYLFETWKEFARRRPELAKAEIELGCLVPICSGGSGGAGSEGELYDRWIRCGGTETIILPKYVVTLTSAFADPTVQLDGAGMCYVFDQADVAGPPASFTTITIYSSCLNAACDNCDCETLCARVEAEFEFGGEPVEGHLEVDATDPCGEGYPVSGQRPGNIYITLTEDGLKFVDGRWQVTMRATDDSWEATFLGPVGGCPFGTFAFSIGHGTSIGAAPSTIEVVACACDCNELATVKIVSGGDEAVVGTATDGCTSYTENMSGTMAVAEAGLHTNLGFWEIDYLEGPGGAWSGLYIGPVGDGTTCPYGTYTLDDTFSGSPPATVQVVPGS